MPDDTRARLVELSQGMLIEQDVLGIVERIQEYDSNILVQYLDPGVHGELTDAPYRIMELCPDGMLRLVFTVWELDERVLKRLFEADNQKHRILERVDAMNHEVRQGLQRRFREEALGEAHELSVSILKSNKTEYSIPGDTPGENTVIHTHQPSKTITRTGLVKKESDAP